MEKIKYTACIIDDEKSGSDYINLLLNNEFPNIEVIFVGRTVSEAAMFLLKQQPDILFLDVQLKDGNVFKLFESIKIEDIKSQILFITAYDSFAIPAIKSNAVDYLLKPTSPLDFVIAVNKCIKRIEFLNSTLNQRTPNSTVSSSFINIPCLSGFIRLKINSIVYFEADANYTYLYLENGESIVSSKNIKEYERQLISQGYIRIHHKYLINLNYVTKYLKGKGGQVVLQNRYTIEVSVRKKAELMAVLQM